MYAQKIEGDLWRGEKLDKGKIDKMSGMVVHLSFHTFGKRLTCFDRSAAWAVVRADEGNTIEKSER